MKSVIFIMTHDVCNFHKNTLLSVQYSQQNFVNI